MPSSTDIVNLALSLLKSNLQITNLSTEPGAIGKLARLWYPIKRDELLTSRPWSFCKKTFQLVQVATNPTPVWAFSYQEPTDCLFPRRILGVTTNVVGTLSFNLPSNSLTDIGNLYAPQVDTPQSAIPFEVAQGLIFTNQMNAILEYTQQVLSEGSYPPKFTLALAYSLAAEMAPTLTDGDPFGIGSKMESKAKQKYNEAAAEDLNAKVSFQPDAEALRARRGY